jgi:hypothetical protein
MSYFFQRASKKRQSLDNIRNMYEKIVLSNMDPEILTIVLKTEDIDKRLWQLGLGSMSLSRVRNLLHVLEYYSDDDILVELDSAIDEIRQTIDIIHRVVIVPDIYLIQELLDIGGLIINLVRKRTSLPLGPQAQYFAQRII